MKKTILKELENFLETLNIHNRKLNICFYDAVAANHILELSSKALDEQRNGIIANIQTRKRTFPEGEYYQYPHP